MARLIIGRPFIKRLVAGAFALFLVAGAAGGADGSAELSLGDVFRLVRERNTTVLAGAEDVSYAEQSRREARAALVPQIGAQASQMRSRSMSDLGLGGLSPYLANDFSAGLTASYTIIDAQIIANYKAAKLTASAARYQQEVTVQDTFAAAAQLFFLYQRNLSALEVIEDSIRLDKVLLDRAQQRREANVATDLDVTRAKATLAKDQQNRLAQKTVTEQTRLALLEVVGMDLDSSLSLAAFPLAEPGSLSIPHWTVVLEKRPEYKAAQELLDRNRVAERAAQWQRFPSISAQGGYGYGSYLPADGDGGTEWGVGIAASMPLFEGGRISAQKEEARAMIRQQKQLIRKIGDNVHSSLNLAVAALEHRWAELPLARESVRLAELEVQYARDRFEAGVSDNSDLISAQVALSSANDSLVDAEYRYNLARIDLARVLGDVQSGLSL